MTINNSINAAIPFAVTNGGTGTSNAFTSGSVVFAGSSGVYNQNNSSFFWDNTNNRLGIGTATPGALIEVLTTSGINSSISVRAIGATPGDAVLSVITSSATRSAYVIHTSGSNSWLSGITSTDGNFYLTGGSPVVNVIAADYTSADVNISTGNLAVKSGGKGLRVAETGAAAKQGVATLSTNGTVVVANTGVTANSRILITIQSTPTGTAGFLRISTRTVGTSFTIQSSSTTDRSIVAWEIFEPA